MRLALIADGAVLVLVLAVGLAARSTTWTAADDAVVRAVNGGHARWLDVLALALNRGFGPSVAAFVAVAVACAVGLWRRSALTAVYTVGLTGAPWLCAEIIKLIIRRVRPDPSLITHPLVSEPVTFSYPSGHTAFAFALVLAVVVTVTDTRRAVLIGWVTAMVIGAVTAWSRVYVGAHYPTDVIASLVLVPAVMSLTRIVVFWVMPQRVLTGLHDRSWPKPGTVTRPARAEKVDF